MERRFLMKDKVPDVRIEVIQGGKLKYYPEELHRKRGEKILWACDSNPFAIQFLDSELLDEGTGSHHGNSGVLRGTVKKDAKHGLQRYACSVYASGQVYLDAKCPAIIIDP